MAKKITAYIKLQVKAGQANPSPPEVGSKPCRSVSQGVGLASCLPKTAWPPDLGKRESKRGALG